jgi:hypothetical protein
LDQEDSADLDRERVIEKLSLDYADEFLKFCTRSIDLSHLQSRYKLIKVCEEEAPVSKSEFLEAQEVEQDDFYQGTSH